MLVSEGSPSGKASKSNEVTTKKERRVTKIPLPLNKRKFLISYKYWMPSARSLPLTLFKSLKNYTVIIYGYLKRFIIMQLCFVKQMVIVLGCALPIRSKEFWSPYVDARVGSMKFCCVLSLYVAKLHYGRLGDIDISNSLDFSSLEATI